MCEQELLKDGADGAQPSAAAAEAAATFGVEGAACEAAAPSREEDAACKAGGPSAADGDAKEQKRIRSIDRFRGFCVACMLIFQFMNNFPSLGLLYRLASHNPSIGIVILPTMTLADVIAPAFIFAIGMTFALSFRRRCARYGMKRTILHFVERALAIVGLGTFMSFSEIFIESFSGRAMAAVDWVLFALSAAMLIGLVMRLLPLQKKVKHWKTIGEQVFYISISLLGLVNIVLAFVDYAAIQPGRYWYWSTLQGIGFCMLLALPFICAKPWIKLLGALVIGAAFSVYHQLGNNQEILDIMVHGGVVGAFGWASMLLLDMFTADLYFHGRYAAFALSAGLAAIGVFLIQWLGDAIMGSCSPTFILIGSGLSGVLFMIFDLLDRFHRSSFDPLAWWGLNPLILFVIQFFIIGIYAMVAPASLIAEAPWWSAALQSLALIVLLHLFVWFLAKRKKSIRL